MTTPAQDPLSAALGEAPAAPANPSTAPNSPTSVSVGTDTPDSTTGTGTGGPATGGDPLAAALGEADQTTQNTGGGNTSPSGGFLQGVGEGSGASGVVSAIKAANQESVQQHQTILDAYHAMVDAHRAGDNRTAAKYAQQIMGLTASKDLKDSFSGLREAAKMVVLDPVKAIQEQRALNQKVQADQKAGVENPNTMKAVWDKAKQDWNAPGDFVDNSDKAVGDVLAGTLGQPGINAIPLIGPMISSMANNVNDAAQHNDRGRIVGNAVGAGLAAAIPAGLSKVSGVLPEAGGAAAGLDAGQAGADAAQTAADTAQAHDALLQANKDQFQTQLETSLQKAQDARDTTEGTVQDTKTETGNTDAERTAAHKDIVERGRDAQHQAIDNTLERQKQAYADQFKQTLDTQSAGAADPEDLAKKFDAGINEYEKKSHTDFEEGMTGGDPENPTPDSVIGALKGKSIPAADSPMAEAAADALKKPKPNDHAYRVGSKNLAGIKLDGEFKKYLEDVSKGEMTVKAPGPADEAGNPGPMQDVKRTAAPLTADQLIGIRQDLRAAAQGFPRGDLNRITYGKMINAVDETLEKLAGKGGANAVAKYDALRANYKTAQGNLDTSVADKLHLDKSDQALNDVNKYLLNSSAAKIKVIGHIVGDETMQGARQAFIKQLSEMGPEEAAKTLAKIPDLNKQAFFGPELDGRLAAAQDVYRKSVTNAETVAESQKQYISQAADSAIGNGSVQARYDRQANTAAARKAMDQAAADYNVAKQKAVDISKQQNAPYNTTFANAISDGSIGKKLASDKIATSDITALKAALDPADFAKIQQGVVQRQMAEATTAGHFNPVKFLNWYDDIPHAAQEEFFSDVSGQPMTVDISGIRDASKLQKIARIGTLGGAGAIVKIAPGSALKGLFEVLAGASAVSRKELFTNLLDTVASNPRLLKNMSRTFDNVSNAGKVVGATSGAATVAGDNQEAQDQQAKLHPSFGKRVRVNGQTGTVLGNHPDSGKPFVEWDK